MRISAAAFAAAAFAATPLWAAANAAAFERIAPAVEREIEAGRIPGAVVLVGRGNEVLYRRAFGERSLVPEREPMTLDTIFDLASLTKVVATTTAVLQLVEQGRLALDEPVARYWPRFAQHGKARITVRDLLTHASGLRPDLDLRSGWNGHGAALRRIVAERPVAPAGKRYLYSDINFEVLGELVRRVSGLSLDRYCERYIFAPLGMSDTAFRVPAHKRARVAPTTYRGGALLRGEVHDPSAHRMGGVAGHAGLFSSADDLARFAQMLLAGGSLNGARILRAGTVGAMTRVQNPGSGGTPRGLGWELAAAPFAEGAGAQAFGHTGFTGTSIWIDPLSKSYAIVLTNRVHPHGRGDARPLRAQLATIMADASGADRQGIVQRASGRVVKPGIDVLAEQNFAPLAGLRVGLIANHSALSANGSRSVDLLRDAKNVTLAALFSPEHGLYGDADAPVASGREPASMLPVHSLYGDVRRPTDEMLDGLDALVFDIQDAGVRFYTYVTTMAYAMEAAARRGIAIFVLDRPNPIGADIVQGPVLDEDLRSFTGYFALPLRYGMTIGELARFLNTEARIGARLTVIPMQGYRRKDWYDDTGLRWVAPSPNLRSVAQAALYPGVAMVEGANVSVGRGTATPFEVLGTPWIDARRLADYLNRRNIRGVRFRPDAFRPSESRYAGQRCNGVRVELVDRTALDAPLLGLEITAALHRLYPAEFRLERTLGMIGSRATLAAIAQDEDPAAIAARWSAPLEAFRRTRERYLLYLDD